LGVSWPWVDVRSLSCPGLLNDVSFAGTTAQEYPLCPDTSASVITLGIIPVQASLFTIVSYDTFDS